MPGLIIYTTIDGKTISVRDIFYIDAISDAENGLNQYKIVQQNGDAITVAHENKEALKKDRRKLELTWEKCLRYR